MAIVDECIHGLTAAWCSLCKEKDKRSDRAERRRAKSWNAAVEQIDGPHRVAQFDSDCPDCSEQILAEVDEVFLRDGRWVCIVCAQVMDLESERERVE